MDDLIRRSEAQELLKCYTEKNNLGHTPYQIVSHLPSAGLGWISVEEELPSKEDGYDVVLNGKVSDFALYVPGKGFGMYSSAAWMSANDIVTHWSPLPEPPQTIDHEAIRKEQSELFSFLIGTEGGSLSKEDYEEVVQYVKRRFQNE